MQTGNAEYKVLCYISAVKKWRKFSVNLLRYPAIYIAFYRNTLHLMEPINEKNASRFIFLHGSKIQFFPRQAFNFQKVSPKLST